MATFGQRCVLRIINYFVDRALKKQEKRDKAECAAHFKKTGRRNSHDTEAYGTKGKTKGAKK